MWTGGVRVILLDEEGRMLLVRQNHGGKNIWMVPGGGIEEGESAVDAAVREVQEETELDIEISRLLWHVEEVSDRGQRFVNFFLGELKSGTGNMKLGYDPELAENEQVLREVRFMSKEEMADLEVLYPEFLKDEFWHLLEDGKLEYNAFRMREIK
ncbi:MAG: NUDIX hydrolase [Bacillota bacterium]|nr:NUDIX hydrolase [Bacillota bacterium]